MQTEVVNLLESVWSLHVLSLPLDLYLAGHLEVVLLLADKSLVYLREIEAFVSADHVRSIQTGTKNKEFSENITRSIKYGLIIIFD